MKIRLLVSALLKLTNMAILLVSLGLAYVLTGILANAAIIAYPAGVAIYLSFVIANLLSKDFHEEFNRKQKIRQIQDLNYACLRLSNEAKKHTNSTYYQKLRRVMEDKNDIVDSFFRGEKSYLKQKIVEQTLNLVLSYTRLLMNFCIRSRELSEMDFSDIVNRINENTRKLGFVEDLDAVEDIIKVIEMDEKIINRLKDEKIDLERIDAKLDYMGSAVNMFKHQIISSIESEEMLETLETAVNEATALDNVLEERRKNGIRTQV